MLARRLPRILPKLDDRAALEVTRIHSVAGLLPANAGLLQMSSHPGASEVRQTEAHWKAQLGSAIAAHGADHAHR